MAKFRYESTTLDFTTGIGAPSFPAPEGLSLHSYPTGKPFYTVTNRKHGTTQIQWESNGVQQALKDTIKAFWSTTLTEGYSNFTVVDHRLRMLFEASWNDWIKRWSKRRGGIYDITYQIESPIPWTAPTYGIYPMCNNDLVNHNLSGDDLTATDGVLTTNAADSAVLRLNGSALKMEGDGSSSGLLGASATVDWKRTTKNNPITLFCQFMSDATLTTGNLAALEVTHSNNVFRLGIKPSGTGGALTYINQYNAGIEFSQCKIDSDYGVAFFSRGSGTYLYTKKYTNSGVFSDADNDNSGLTAASGYQMALDKTLSPRIVLTTAWDAFGDGMTMHSYDSDGLLTYIDVIGAAVASPKGVVIDNTLSSSVAFIGQAFNGGALILSYPYTGAGFGAQIDSAISDTRLVTWMEIDTEYKIIHVRYSTSIGGGGLISVSYDSNGDNITEEATANTFSGDVNLSGCDIDTTRKFVFDCSNSGLYVYSYNSSGVYSAALSSVTDKSFVSARVDSLNRLVYATASGDGVYVYRYATDGTSLTQVSFDDQGGNYLGCALDSTAGVLACIKSADGFYSYSIGVDTNQVFGKIVNNADSAEVRKGASTYHELTNSAWYDLAFTYDANTEKSFLYFAESGDSSFTDFLSGETDITEGIGEYGNQDATVQSIPWTACNLLKELTNDVVADGSNVYIQNAMVFDGFVSSHQFNTLRRLCYLWNKKTDTYPK